MVSARPGAIVHLMRPSLCVFRDAIIMRELICVCAQMRYSCLERPGDGPGFEGHSRPSRFGITKGITFGITGKPSGCKSRESRLFFGGAPGHI
jgi:hypothetical protein